jgi:hypothetical protein
MTSCLGTVMTLMGLIVNRQGLYAARWFLGIAEAGICLLVDVSQYIS